MPFFLDNEKLKLQVGIKENKGGKFSFYFEKKLFQNGNIFPGISKYYDLNYFPIYKNEKMRKKGMKIFSIKKWFFFLSKENLERKKIIWKIRSVEPFGRSDKRKRRSKLSGTRFFNIFSLSFSLCLIHTRTIFLSLNTQSLSLSLNYFLIGNDEFPES